MAPHRNVTHDSPRTDRVARLLDRWYRLRPIEHNGRCYRLLGLVPVFACIARLFGERLPEPDRLASAEVAQIRMRARYHELINLMSIAVQLPLPWLAWRTGNVPLTAYGLALLVPHVLSVMLERFKRAICEASSATSVSSESPEHGPAKASDHAAASDCPAAHWYFGPFACENERLYEVLGVEAFRRFVLTLIRVSAPPAKDGALLRNVRGGRRGLAAFEEQTRTAELTHLFGTLLHVPFAVAFALAGFWSGFAFVLVLFALNIICALLQRQHRVRLAKLLRASAGRAAQSRSEPCGS